MAGELAFPPSFPRSLPCQTCATVAESTFTCIQCNNLSFCDACWSKWVLHLPGAVGWNGKPHEKADPLVVDRLRQILEPTRTEEEHAAELLEDQDTTWFGYGRDASNHPQLNDYGRFAAIMAETHTEDAGERYPQLASFIGETGAGKSTLIKLLIDRQDLSPQGSRYYSPVTSSNQDRISTTGDVHLYADPSTLYATSPLLFIDCEGLSGGEAAPKQLKQSQDSSANYPRRYAVPRKIEWALTPQTQKREFAVSQLYPRILYTFSDVVVFVLRNPRSFESTVLHRLIKWGAASIDKSINQPVLPHAVIVLNATDTNVDEKEWDVSKATQMFLSDISDAIRREPLLQQYAQTWRQRGRRLNTTKELLECYYASISVVRIPYKGSYMLMNDQAGKLSDLIKDRCAAAHARKKQLRMLANTEKLQFYLQAAFDHFTRDLNSPFDFVKEMLRHSPASRNFEGNILNLALLIKDSSVHAGVRDDAEEIFRAIGPMIASCIMLDAVRQKLPGAISRLLDDRYAKSCTGAMQTFAGLYWPCSFRSAAHGELGQCCNVKMGHNPKGHQNKQGKIIGHGEYQSDFNVTTFQPAWEQLIRTSLVQVQCASTRLAHEFPDRSELEIAALLHQERLNELYSNNLGSALSFVSYSSCLCCLRELPECALPCGHILCLPCIEIYGRRTSRTTIEVNRCPIHVRDVIANPPWIIVTKPRYAGARTLCLDGGGVRGIVQLQVLRELEKILGPDLPIQLFFDLIVGSDFGGIVAIALGVKKWSVSSALEKFKDLCREAYIARGISKLPFSGTFSSFYHKSLYKHQPIESALRRYLSEQPLFGATSHRSSLTVSTKVAVTATTAAGCQHVVFTNYNRPDLPEKKIPYHFSRSSTPAKEIRMWEAARATTATAPLFSPYNKPETDTEYASGGMRSMCPILVAHYEAKSVWKDIAGSPPDLVLSIGNGRNIGDSSKAELKSPISLYTATSDSLATSNTPSAVIRQGRGGMGNYKRQSPPGSTVSDPHSPKSASRGYIVRNPQAPMLLTFNNPISGQTDRLNDPRISERIWNSFLSTYVAQDASIRQRYRRVCPELFSKLPKFDDISKLDDVEREAQAVLRHNTDELVEIAHRLVASTFFFEKDVASVKQKASEFICTGSIFCRFRPGSPEIKALAWFLISLLDGDFEPYFLLEEESLDDEVRPVRQFVLTSSVLQDMHLQGNFQLDPIRINAAHESSEITISLCMQSTPYSSGVGALPISGFPRRLMSEDGSGVHQAVISMNSRSTIQRQPTAINTDVANGLTTPTSASFSFSTSVGGTPVSPPFSHFSFDKLSIGPDADDLPELEG
ncbi:FabD/lysophospholipase-like protein [Nemania sp. NC0429]|nr:FabD/lysophospholipase-like protein [Nemania sp. NC0429]